MNSTRSSTRRTGSFNKLLLGYAMILTLFLVFTMTKQIPTSILLTEYMVSDTTVLPPQHHSTTESIKMADWDRTNPLAIPTGKAQNLPSIRVDEPEVDKKRKIYGGVVDKKHLGGFTDIDLDGISPAVWSHMVTKFGVKSVLDVGCGRGISSLWFLMHGVDVLCVEGSHDAVERTMLPDPDNLVVEHDFSRGPWWPEKTFSACWAVEFLEHVSLQFQFNYIMAFRKCALIFATSSIWGGWHHTEVHSHDWWVRKFEVYGFEYSSQLTSEIRTTARTEGKKEKPSPNGKAYRANHIINNMKVFVNPIVAALPEHYNLFPEFGCFEKSGPNREIINRECGEGRHGAMETRLDKAFYPLELTPEMDTAWEGHLKNNIEIHDGDKEAPAAPAEKAVSKVDDMVENGGVSANALSNPDAGGPRVEQPVREDDIHPVLAWREGKISLEELPTIPVVVWPYLEFGIGNAESLHIEENGINETRFLSLEKSMTALDDPNVVWVGDTGAEFGRKPWCREYLKRIKTAMEARKQKGMKDRWPIFIVDFTDGARMPRCIDIELLMGHENVHYSTRAIVLGRAYSNETDWVRLGRTLSLTMPDGREYLHSPLVVRTDTVKSLREVLKSNYGMTLDSPIEQIKRDVDVSHFWPSNGSGVRTFGAKLRHTVSTAIEELSKSEGINVFVGLAGSAVRAGRRGVKSIYIESLLSSKINVVTQRDFWEDHYRLFESLVTGGMVITDKMLSLPTGLQNGTNIIECTSREDLKSKIIYYLGHPDERIEIARQGRLTAMSYHRSWHRMEEIIFGAPLSICYQQEGSPCPFIVHASEVTQRRKRRR